ncbi:MAG: hypothetical protein WC889_20015, partial [Myxococcota bacterium]
MHISLSKRFLAAASLIAATGFFIPWGASCGGGGGGASGDGSIPADTGGKTDAGKADAGKADAGMTDAGKADAGVSDVGVDDVGGGDPAEVDGGLDSGLDAGSDAGAGDGGTVDAGTGDAGEVDAGTGDSGPVDTGVEDSGTGDTGIGDGGGSCNLPVQTSRLRIVNGCTQPIWIFYTGTNNSTVLYWATANATSCTLNGGSVPTQSPSGGYPVRLKQTTTYTLTCAGPGGPLSQTATVVVNPMQTNLTIYSFQATPISANPVTQYTLTM